MNLKQKIKNYLFQNWYCIRRYSWLLTIECKNFYDRPIDWWWFYWIIPCTFEQKEYEPSGKYHYHFYYIKTIFGNRYKFKFWWYDQLKHEHFELAKDETHLIKLK